MDTEPLPDPLADFCANLPRLRSLLSGPASAARRAAVERAAEAIRRGEPVGLPLAELGFPRGTRGAPAGGAPRQTSSLPPPVHAEQRTITGVYLCPRGQCDRMELRAAGSELPSCHVHEQALRFVPDE
ncbi:hypothetical protein [Amycolatopsis cihanbeyliensis]|uniref:Uncharacterized protein n=1 Tax=Amycolatopsis cihanbeyliensis TaxID=1128664 RepID=A0A542DH72_AMYCI|nr:hypothetical protein [Amycolatopsis cihanbeyliensis]TQJ02401.1 hypothetical protein FB471_2127 [Amycolatopsis cihanbeyliensis]